jgi:hypothetical protein
MRLVGDSVFVYPKSKISRGLQDMSDNNGNGGPKLDLNGIFEVGDLGLVIDGLRFAANRVRFTGRTSEDASKRLVEIVEKLKALAPIAGVRNESGVVWFEMAAAARECESYGAYLLDERDGYSGRKYSLDVIVDRKMFRLVNEGDKAAIEASLPGLLAQLRDLAPVDAEPLRVLQGMVDLPGKVSVLAETDRYDTFNIRKCAALQKAMRMHLKGVATVVRVLDGENRSYSAPNGVETRFAVPASEAEAVIAFIREFNTPSFGGDRGKPSGKDFEFPAPVRF